MATRSQQGSLLYQENSDFPLSVPSGSVRRYDRRCIGLGGSGVPRARRRAVSRLGLQFALGGDREPSVLPCLGEHRAHLLIHTQRCLNAMNRYHHSKRGSVVSTVYEARRRVERANVLVGAWVSILPKFLRNWYECRLRRPITARVMVHRQRLAFPLSSDSPPQLVLSFLSVCSGPTATGRA